MTKWLFDKRFANRVKLRYERYDIQAGILQNGPHYEPQGRTRAGKRRKFTEVEGLKARRKSRIQNGTLESVSKSLRRNTGINIYRAPFTKRKATKEVKQFRKALTNFFGKGRANLRKTAEIKLVEALRAPIRKRQYGPNSILTAGVKGFNRLMFDTGQLYKAMRARIKRKPKGGSA